MADDEIIQQEEEVIDEDQWARQLAQEQRQSRLKEREGSTISGAARQAVRSRIKSAAKSAEATISTTAKKAAVAGGKKLSMSLIALLGWEGALLIILIVIVLIAAFFVILN